MHTIKLSRLAMVMAVALLMIGAAIGPAAAAPAPIRLKYGHVQPESHFTTKTALWMADQLKARSGGRIEMSVYPNSALGGQNELFEGLRLGDVDFAWIATGSLSRQIPELGLLSVSYLIDGLDHYLRLVERDGAMMTWVSDAIQKREPSVRLAGMLGGSPRRLYNKRRPINTPQDLKGLKIRVQDSPIEGKVWAALGARPVPLAWAEIYTALQMGVIDGAESSTEAYEVNKFYEVAPFHTLTEHQWLFMPQLISERTYRRLPADLQKIVMDVAWEASLKAVQFCKEEESAVFRTLESRGVKIGRPSLQPFIDIMAPLQDEVAADLGAQQLLKIIRQSRAK